MDDRSPDAWASLRAEPSFAVVGLGGAGGDAVRDLLGLGLTGVRSFAINTDARQLDGMVAPRRILIGARELKGRGSGGNRLAARRAAEDSRAEILRSIADFEIVFLLAGLGGGTGSALLPYLSQELRKTGAMPVPVAFLPFHHELSSPGRRENTEQSLEELEGMGGFLLALSNEKLLRFRSLPFPRALHLRNAYVHCLVSSLVDMVEYPSQMNVDIASIKTHLGAAGLSTLVWGERHHSEPERLVEQAMRETLLDYELSARPSALIHMDGGSNLTLDTFERLLESFRTRLGDPRDIVVGARTHDEPRDVLRLTAVVGGLKPQSVREALEAVPPGRRPLPAD